MSGPNSREDKKKMEEAKKAVQGEVKKLAKKTKKKADDAKGLVKEKKELEKKKQNSDEKKRAKEIDKKLDLIVKSCQREADVTAQRIGNMLQNYVPEDKAALPTWQKGMSKWYINILNKEPGFDIGGGTRINGDISVKEKKVIINFTKKR